MKDVKRFLLNIKEDSNNLEYTNRELTKEVIDIILDNGVIDKAEINTNNELILSYMSGVQKYGCVSGMIPELMYYSDTEKFFIKHMDDIFDLYNELKEECGEINMELNSNNLAWFGFEQTIDNLMYQIEEYLEEE